MIESNSEVYEEEQVRIDLESDETDEEYEENKREEGGQVSDEERKARLMRRAMQNIGKQTEGPQQSDEESAETRQAKPLHNPINPSKREVELHELTHIPFRSWCHAQRER